MTMRMLIDAAHAEETRVVVVDDGQLLDFDFESSTKRQIKGNIYLAKVIRVEPSLQAAFVEYGGNRHGFLPFSEIHPDYYQIPQADREMLEKLEREAQAKAAAEAEPEQGNGANGQAAEGPQSVTQDAEEETADVVDELARRRARLLRSYKIQEVIKRRQILLVQVVKEERGSKGAALTTYLSLAGRYCVLMPNTPRGGGISRKIVNPDDRRRLKAIAAELDVPPGMGLIIRTAGAERSKAEIKRDYEYLLRLWNEIRETTLKSIAPCLIHEEGDLVRRALRDLYTRDIEEVLIEGEAAYRTAKRFMQMLMPSRARQIKLYEDEVPLFYRYQVEEQLDKMYRPVVTLPSGGSIVIHTTEALTAIDVNSGRSTRERHIDETAVKTNLEAADEIARQLRLRDLAGLIVIDFIDMADQRHQRAVEKRLKDALKADRARIQVGRISMFGLLELSRQRLRPSLQELSSQTCPHCEGTGVVRSTESCALQALRLIQDAGIKREAKVLEVRLPSEVAFYLLNRKRELLVRLEQRYGLTVEVRPAEPGGPPKVELAVLEKREEPVEAAAEAPAEAAAAEPAEARAAQPRPAAAPGATAAAGEEGGEEGPRRRRRRRRGAEGEVAQPAVVGTAGAPSPDFREPEAEERGEAEPAAEAETPLAAAEVAAAPAGEPVEASAAPPVELPAVAEPAGAEPGAAAAEEAPPVEAAAAERRPRRRRRSRAKLAPAEVAGEPPVEAGAEPPSEPAGAEAAEPLGAEAPVAVEPAVAAEAAEGPVDGAVREPAREPPGGPPAEAAEPQRAATATAAAPPAPAAEPAAAGSGGAPAATEPSGEPRAEEAKEPAETPPSPPRPPRQGWWSRWVRPG